MPFKVFQVNEILTAADVNDFLAEQVVATFAGTAARGSAIGTPVTGQLTYLEDSGSLEVYGGTASGWVSARSAALGSAFTGDRLVYDGSDWVADAVPGDNLLYNGAMQVHQRGTAVTGVTSSGYYTADRWQMSLLNIGTWTNTVETDAPSGSGFRKSFKVECTTADAAPAASANFNVLQPIEGQDLQVLKKGTANAESLTVSFWVKSNVTGTYIFRIQDLDNNRQIAAAYSIVSSGTWERKVITFPGDTTGVLNNDNSTSMIFQFGLAVGSDRTSGTLATSWGSNVLADSFAGQTNLAASTGNYWQVTGVQLETGTVATAFEHKPYGTELAECQRYYVKFGPRQFGSMGVGYGISTTQAVFIRNLPVTMRVPPTSLEYADLLIAFPGVTAATVSSLIFEITEKDGPSVRADATGLTQSRPYTLATSNATGYLAFNAEL